MASRSRKLALAILVSTTGVAANCAVSTAKAEDQSKGAPTREALQRKTALKLAGLATFVADSCPELKLDLDRFKAAITALGVSTQDLDDKTTRFAFLEYTMTYKQNVKANCARAKIEFGPDGKTLPKLFQVVEVPAKPPAAATPPAGNAAPAAPAPAEKKP